MRDIQLIESLVTFFNCGQIKKDPRDLNSGVYINVTDFSNILKKVLPFFAQYPILGNKYLDYQSFVQVAKIIEEKGHLTQQGLDRINQIKSSMNSSRLNDK